MKENISRILVGNARVFAAILYPGRSTHVDSLPHKNHFTGPPIKADK